MLSCPGSLGNTEGILNPGALWARLGEGLAPGGGSERAPSWGPCAGMPPLSHPAGKEMHLFPLTFLPLGVVPPPEAHVDFGPRLRLLNHRGLHTDQVLP